MLGHSEIRTFVEITLAWIRFNSQGPPNSAQLLPVFFNQVLRLLEIGNWRDTFGFKACDQENITRGKEFEQLSSKEKPWEFSYFSLTVNKARRVLSDFFLFYFCVFVFETRSCYVTQTDFNFRLLLSQPPEGWDCKCRPPCSANFSLLWSKGSLLHLNSSCLAQDLEFKHIRTVIVPSQLSMPLKSAKCALSFQFSVCI